MSAAAKKPSVKFAWDAVDAARHEAGMAGEAPPESFSMPEYAERYGLPSGTAYMQLRRMERTGKLKTGHRPGTTLNGRRIIMRVYWPA